MFDLTCWYYAVHGNIWEALFQKMEQQRMTSKIGYNREKKAIRLLNSLLWSNKMKLQTKLTIYTTIVEPTLTYGCECWQISCLLYTSRCV